MTKYITEKQLLEWLKSDRWKTECLKTFCKEEGNKRKKEILLFTQAPFNVRMAKYFEEEELEFVMTGKIAVSGEGDIVDFEQVNCRAVCKWWNYKIISKEQAERELILMQLEKN